MLVIRQSVDDKISILRDAIRNVKQVTGLGKCLPREFCPHIMGTKNHVWRVLTWQFAGLSNSGDLPGWRGFDLDDLDQIALRDGEWHRGSTTGQRDQSLIDLVDTIVDPAHAAEIRESAREHKAWPTVRRR